MTDVDDYDFICHVAFDQKPLTRRERANNVKKRDFLSRYSGVARQVLTTWRILLSGKTYWRKIQSE